MITCGDLPAPGDREAIVGFARLFRGYSVHGSFEACADEAQKKRRETVEDLQNELFFAYRAGNHAGDRDIIVRMYDELLPFFMKLLTESPKTDDGT